jgi:hypothetical protein
MRGVEHGFRTPSLTFRIYKIVSTGMAQVLEVSVVYGKGYALLIAAGVYVALVFSYEV